ncbi:MAG TPA: sensor domain-containing diguanylate cyclase [Burkholderiaceae bacterium]
MENAETERLRLQLAQLLAEARRNEDILRRHQEIDLKFIGAASFLQLIDNIFEYLAAPSKLDVVTLALIDADYEIRHILQDLGVGLDEFPSLLFCDNAAALGLLRDLARPELGPYDEDNMACIFPEQVLTPASVALLPLRRQDRLLGMLGLGSCQDGRFARGMATDFLEHMTAIVAVCLENVLNIERLKHLGLMDPLTGVNNRRYVETRLIEEVGRSRRHTGSLSCLYLDIDHFKKINDGFGHQCGDEVLREAAQRIKAELRLSDTLGRHGGEEFIALLPDTPPVQAQNVAERIRAGIGDKPFVFAGEERRVTISIGVANLGAHLSGLPVAAAGQRLIADADHALYRAKANGRNRVEIFN